MADVLHMTIVTAPECHLCEYARQVLHRISRTWPLALEEVAWQSPEGAALVHGDGIPFPPALYIEGTFFGYGRLSEGKLRRWLDRRLPR